MNTYTYMFSYVCIYIYSTCILYICTNISACVYMHRTRNDICCICESTVVFRFAYVLNFGPQTAC